MGCSRPAGARVKPVMPLDKRDGVVSIALLLLAGLVAYWAYALGASGPLVIFGQGDATRSVVDAWQQVPLHAAVATLLVLGGWNGPPMITSGARVAGVLLVSLLIIWTAALTVLNLVSLGDHSDPVDVFVAAALLVTYSCALILTRRAGPSG